MHFKIIILTAICIIPVILVLDKLVLQSILFLFVDNPFQEKDRVKLTTKNITIEGIVVKRAWYYTTILPDDNIPISINNSLISTMAIENHSRRHNSIN